MLARSAHLARLWDILCTRPAGAIVPPRRLRSLALETLEDRVVPASAAAMVDLQKDGAVATLIDSSGQTLLTVRPFEGTTGGDVRTAIADLTGDGVFDLIAAAGPGSGPRVRAFDGRTGAVVADFFAGDPADRSGVWVAAGAIGGNEIGILTGSDAGTLPRLGVYSASGELRHEQLAFEPSFQGGVRVAADPGGGENYQPTWIALAGPGGGPRVRAFDSSRGGEVVADFYAFEPEFTGGLTVAIGDVTGDGRSDLVVGAGPGGGPHVRVFDGIKRTLVGDFMVGDADSRTGTWVGTWRGGTDPQAPTRIVAASLGEATRAFDAVGQEVAADTFAGVDRPSGGTVAMTNNIPTVWFVWDTGTLLLEGTMNKAIVYLTEAAPTGGYADCRFNHYSNQAGPGWATHNLDFGGPGGQVFTFGPGASGLLGYVDCPILSDVMAEPSEQIHPNVVAFSGCTPNQAGTDIGVIPANDPSSPCGPEVGPPVEVGAGTSRPAGNLSASGVASGVGAIHVALPGFATDGFAGNWTETPTWINRGGAWAGTGNGVLGGSDGVQLVPDNPLSGQAQLLTLLVGGRPVETFSRAYVQYPPPAGYKYGALHGTGWTLAESGGVLTLTDGTGGRVTFTADYRFQSRNAPGGQVQSVSSRDTSGRPLEVLRSAVVGGVTISEAVAYTYTPDDQVATATLKRQDAAGGAWTVVRSAEYGYYAAGAVAGNARDLRTVAVRDAAGQVVDGAYLRYYTPTDTVNGYVGGLKTAVIGEQFTRYALAHPDLDAGANPIQDFATYRFEYDAAQRVTKAIVAGAGCSACTGGQGEYTYIYAVRNGSLDRNQWRYKVTEARPDGSSETTYLTGYQQAMLRAVTAGGVTNRTYSRYDAAGRLVFEAAPSAVTGHDEALADLVGFSGSAALHVADTAGLVTTYTYGTATTATATTAGDAVGRLKQIDLKQGDTGLAVPQQLVRYVSRSANGATLFFPATETLYRNANGTGAQTTTLTYTWQGATALPASITTTLPIVTTAQNGPGVATPTVTVFDAFGRPAWMKDADGFLSYAAYDVRTGAVTRSITDVNTANAADFTGLPGGWVTPAGGGLHLVSTAEVDALGRTTKATDPAGRVTYTVFQDAAYEVRVYPGWDAATNTSTGPVHLTRTNRAGGYSESLTFAATPTVVGGRPTGTEAVTDVQSLSRVQRNLAGQSIHTDVYHSLAGVTYSTAANLGTEGTNFLRTRQDYDKQGRPNRSVTPAGTITRTEYDGMGRAVSVWVGTDDMPTTGFWSVTNLAGTDMVKVREYEYAHGGSGNSNLTKVTAYPGLGAAPRVTQTWHDWRNRVVAVKQGVEASENAAVNRPLAYTESDNLGQVVASELYDGDGVSVTVTAGVPVRPAASLLRAKQTSSYDELGRAYRRDTFSVDPVTGVVAANTLRSLTWFDKRGQVVKTQAPGGVVAKSKFDGAGRVTSVFTTDGGGDTTWADALTVTGDVVLEQVDVLRDASGQELVATTRQRFHDASGTGALGTATTGVLARVSHAASYSDLAGRVVASVEVGTNGGAVWTRPASVPARSDTVLVSSVVYDAAGRVQSVTDPQGRVRRSEYDLAGRTTKTIEHFVDGVPSDVDDKTTEYTYGPAGMTSLTARLTGGGSQTTGWVYGVSPASGSAITSHDIVGTTRWPDAVTGSASATEEDVVRVNALGQPVSTTDRAGTVHAVSYDVLGRVVADTVTTLGANVDGSVRRVETAYTVQGQVSVVTSFGAVVAGAIVNQVQRDYNGLGQLMSEWQSHGGVVVPGTTPRVQYAHSFSPTAGGANHSRLVSVTYPNGRVVGRSYGAAGGLNDRVSRLSALTDGGVTLEGYEYLGPGAVVARTHPQSGVDLTYVKRAGEANGDAGDPYTGLDRFGRVVDQRWLVASSGVAVDRYQYGYDRVGNRLYKDNLVLTTLGEVYSYDGLDQLTGTTRGTLNAAKTGVTGTPTRSQAFDYDAAGNFDSVTTDGVVQSRTANRQNEVTSISGATTPLFDAAGNMTRSETGQQFVYDGWNRLVQVKSSGGVLLASYAYDGLGRRVSEVPNSGAKGSETSLYYSASWQVLEERVGGVTRASYVWSPVYVDALVARDRDADGVGGNGLEERLYGLADANHNVTALVSASGAVLERYVYDAYGVASVRDAAGVVKPAGSGYAWVYRHQGGRQSDVSGLVSFRHREYSPTLKRWVQVDPIGYRAGDVNLYRYVGNHPVSATDPFGTEELTWQVSLNGFNDSEWKQLQAAISCAVAKLIRARQMLRDNWGKLEGFAKIRTPGAAKEFITPSYKKLCGDISYKDWTLAPGADAVGYTWAKKKVRDHILAGIDLGLKLLQEGRVTFKADRSPITENGRAAGVVYTLGVPGRTVYITDLFWKKSAAEQCDIIKHEIGRLVGWGDENTGSLEDDVYEWDRITDWLSDTWGQCPECQK